MTNLLQRFHFCPKCGGQLKYKQRHGRDRLTCLSCQYVMYENPVVGVACILRQNGRILLGRRAPHSTYPGKWCIPCGYVEYEEDVYAAAVREFEEETGLTVQIKSVFTVLSNFHNPEVHTVGIWFCTEFIDGDIKPGDDIDEVAYFELDSYPEMAFPTDIIVIKKLQNLQKDTCQ